MSTSSGSNPNSDAVQIQDLRFGYGNDPDVLAVSELTLARGEFVFLYGPSGSGKSTLLGLIGGVLTARSGSLQVNGQDLTRLNASRRDQFRADEIGLVFQLFNLIPYLSVIENVTLPCRFSKQRASRAQQKDGTVLDAANRLLSVLDIPDGLLGRKPVDLSVGQQQRVAVARALIGSPSVVIADEPTSALDANTRDRFIELLLSECQKEKSTVLFVSHDASLARHFSRSISLSDLNQVEGMPAHV